VGIAFGKYWCSHLPFQAESGVVHNYLDWAPNLDSWTRFSVLRGKSLHDHTDTYHLAIVVNKQVPPWENGKAGMLNHVLRSIVIFHSSLYDGGFGAKTIQ
jgi:hypothetical protein